MTLRVWCCRVATWFTPTVQYTVLEVWLLAKNVIADATVSFLSTKARRTPDTVLNTILYSTVYSTVYSHVQYIQYSTASTVLYSVLGIESVKKFRG